VGPFGIEQQPDAQRDLGRLGRRVEIHSLAELATAMVAVEAFVHDPAVFPIGEALLPITGN
jgi:hypothetical protein